LRLPLRNGAWEYFRTMCCSNCHGDPCSSLIFSRPPWQFESRMFQKYSPSHSEMVATNGKFQKLIYSWFGGGEVSTWSFDNGRRSTWPFDRGVIGADQRDVITPHCSFFQTKHYCLKLYGTVIIIVMIWISVLRWARKKRNVRRKFLLHFYEVDLGLKESDHKGFIPLCLWHEVYLQPKVKLCPFLEFKCHSLLIGSHFA